MCTYHITYLTLPVTERRYRMYKNNSRILQWYYDAGKALPGGIDMRAHDYQTWGVEK